MTRVYEEINFRAGSQLEEAVKKLQGYKEQGKLVYGMFNGVVLHSDTVTLDVAFLLVTGKTHAEYLKYQSQYMSVTNKENEVDQKNLEVLTEFWRKSGRRVLTPDKWQDWDEVVPIRLRGLYKGLELKQVLDIIKVLDNGGTFKSVETILENQNHSGVSYGLTVELVKEFSNRGEEFAQYLNGRQEGSE